MVAMRRILVAAATLAAGTVELVISLSRVKTALLEYPHMAKPSDREAVAPSMS
jgi:hypothetical protein